MWDCWIIKKNVYAKRDLGILILKLATKQNGRHFSNFCPSLRHFMLKEIWQAIKGKLMTLIKKHLLTERNLGILILKLATKQNGRHFHNFYPSFRHFMIKVIWQVIKGNLMVLISKNLFTGLEVGILSSNWQQKTNKQTKQNKTMAAISIIFAL